MYASLRYYGGDAALADRLITRADDVRDVISNVPGFVAYYLVKAGGDTISVTICDDQAGAEQSNSVAASWLRENMSDALPAPPSIAAGDVVISV